MKFYIEVYGCQMNVYDAQRIVCLLESFGFQETSDAQKAEILIFYTCNIREKAVARLYSNIGRYKNINTKIVAVGGCVAQAEKENIFKQQKAVDIIFGPQVIHKLPIYINEILHNGQKNILDIGITKVTKFNSMPDKSPVCFNEFVTIQEGCDNFCSYCVVPYTRGREYSRPAADVIKEVKRLVANGAKEITLLGQNVNSYHGEAACSSNLSSQKTWNIARLIQEISSTEGLKRLRYVTSHPKDFDKELMLVHKNTKILVPFVHIPLQSGSDRVLKLMNRGHTADEYLAKLDMFRALFPSIQFSSDFIVGFPSETDEDFEQTLQAVKKAKYTLSYSFKYSPRKNTPAEKMPGQISEQTKSKRLKILQDLLVKDQLFYNKKLVGTIQEVLFEKVGRKKNQYIGKNVYLQSVVVESDADIVGQFQNVAIKTASENSVWGELL